MPPLSLLVKPVSGLCNMRCPYCFYADEMRRREVALRGPMTPDTAEKIVRRAFAFADGEVAFAFQGGEPTLAGAAFYRQWLRLEARHNTRRLRVRHTLQTNGLQISEELLEVFVQGRFLLGASLDGTKALHDARRRDAAGGATYDRVTRTLRRLREAGVPCNVLCVVDRRVARAADAVYDALRPYGYMQFIPRLEAPGEPAGEDALTAEDYGRFLIRAFARYASDWRAGRFVSVRAFDNWVGMLCGMPPESCDMRGRCSLQFLVESDGSVYPCDFYALDDWRMGNIREDSLVRLAKSQEAKRFLRTSQAVDARCRDCRWYGLCRGGCRREREGAEGAPGLYRLCEGLKTFFEACYPEMERLARLAAARAAEHAGPTV